MKNFKKLIILILYMIYTTGCGSGNDNSVFDNRDSVISAYSNRDHIKIKEVSSLFLEGIALDITLGKDGKFAYIATGNFGLSVVDIRDPENIKLVSMADTEEYVNHIEVVGDKAYISYLSNDWKDYKNIDSFDISDPYNIVNIGHYDGFNTNGHKLVSENGFVYYIDNEGFKVLNEKNYTIVGQYTLFDTAYAFVLHNGYAYIANGRNGLTVLKVDFSTIND